MRIVYVINSLAVGGAERQVLALADRMAARGHSVALMVLLPSEIDDWTTSLDVVRFNLHKTPLGIARALSKGARFIRAFRPDLVHSHSFHANILARLFKLSYRKANVISTIHNVYEGGWLRMVAYRWSDRWCNLTTAVSTVAAERFTRLKAVPRSKCYVLANAIDTSVFTPDAARRERMRKQRGLADEFVWLAVGRIVPAKDFANLLRAFKEVDGAAPRTQLWIAGDNSNAGKTVDHALATEGVQWLGLCLDIPALLDAADGFVLSSAWEGMPLALGEAMAMQKPFVATDVGGVRELAGETGVVVPAKDASALAQAMLGLMGLSAEVRQAMGRAGRVRIAGGFSMEARADEWESLYTAVIQKEARS
jgi:glycosyltransferase involved in cell wall biosynthesis